MTTVHYVSTKFFEDPHLETGADKNLKPIQSGEQGDRAIVCHRWQGSNVWVIHFLHFHH